MLANAESVMSAASEAMSALSGDAAADTMVGRAARLLERISDRAGARLDDALAALDRASIEIDGAISEITALADDIERDAAGLESVDARLHALRDVARKHSVSIDELPALRDDLAARVALLAQGEQGTEALIEAEREARRTYLAAADELSVSRNAAATRLKAAIEAELPALRLEPGTVCRTSRAAGRTPLVVERPRTGHLRGGNQSRIGARPDPPRGFGRENSRACFWRSGSPSPGPIRCQP